MISYKRGVSCESMSIEHRRLNDPFTREIHVTKSWGAKKAQWSLYKRCVCYGIMSIELWKWQCHPRFDYVHSSGKHKQQSFQLIFTVCLSKALVCYLEGKGKGKGDCFIYRFCVCYGALHGLRKELWHKKAQWSFCKRDVCHSQGAWNCGGVVVVTVFIHPLWNTKQHSFRCFLHMFVQSSCSSTKPICTLWSYIDVLNCLHCVMSPVIEAGLTPLLLSWVYQCSLPLSEALHIIWSRIYYPFLLWCPEVLKFLLPCQNLLHC